MHRLSRDRLQGGAAEHERGGMTSRGFLPVLTAALVSVSTVHAASPADFGFPPAPQGVDVIDRGMVRLEDGSILYAVLYSREGIESMDVLSGRIDPDGTAWELVHTWEIRFEGAPVQVFPDALVSIDEESDGSIWFTFIDEFMYYEGKVCLFLIYDIHSGEFTEGWVD